MVWLFHCLATDAVAAAEELISRNSPSANTKHDAAAAPEMQAEYVSSVAVTGTGVNHLRLKTNPANLRVSFVAQSPSPLPGGGDPNIAWEVYIP